MDVIGVCRRCSRALSGVPSRQMQCFRGTQHLSSLLLPLSANSRRPLRQLHTALAVQQQQQQQQQQRVVSRQQLSWQDLHRAAQIAAWSGLCYLLPDDLAATINRQHQGLTLVASGRNGYTAWFVADGVVPAAQFCTTISSRTSNGNGSSKTTDLANPANSPQQPTDYVTAAAAAAAAHQQQHSNGNGNGSAESSSGGSGGVGVCARLPQGTRERFVFFRGVQWAAPDINTQQLSQALMTLWPTQFPKSNNGSGNGGAGSSSSSSPLVAHAGVAGIAQDLFSQLRPYLQQADDVGMPLCFAGHSLGGSLAMLMLVLHQMHRKNKQQRPWPSCYTYGSPPVLAHERGGGGPPVLQALGGLPPDALNSFVLEMDPVPRALLSVDPTFQLFTGWSAVKGLLQLRELFVGSGSPLSPGRFLFEAVGQVHLIKWTPEGGACVVPLDATEIEQELSLLAPATTPSAAAPPASKAQDGSSTSSSSDGSKGATAASTASGGNGGNSSNQASSILESALAAAGLKNLLGQQVEQQQPQQQQQEASAAAAAPSAAASAGGGGAAAALMNSLRAWLDHHHRSYAQELEAAALRSVREQLAAEQRMMQQPQQQQQ